MNKSVAFLLVLVSVKRSRELNSTRTKHSSDGIKRHRKLYEQWFAQQKIGSETWWRRQRYGWSKKKPRKKREAYESSKCRRAETPLKEQGNTAALSTGPFNTPAERRPDTSWRPPLPAASGHRCRKIRDTGHGE
jgi:hypothetical protein